MSERQIAELAGHLTRFQHCFGTMPNADRQWVIQNTEEAIRLFAAAVQHRLCGNSLYRRADPHLHNLEAVERFVVGEKFVVNLHGELPISHIDEGFQKMFGEVVEERVPAATVLERRLIREATSEQILNQLGFKRKEEFKYAHTALAHVFDYLTRLATDRSKGYFFFVAKEDDLWAVSAIWSRLGWRIYAAPASARSSQKWDIDDRLVAC